MSDASVSSITTESPAVVVEQKLEDPQTTTKKEASETKTPVTIEQNSTTTVEVAKDAKPVSETTETKTVQQTKDTETPQAPVKTRNTGYRTGGKRMMMTGYRPMYPLQMKSDICEEFAKGTCTRGSRCPFLHVAAPGSPKALAMARGNSGASGPAKTTGKTDAPTEGSKKNSKKKKSNAARRAQEKAAEGSETPASTGAQASQQQPASTTTTAATTATAATTTTTEGEEKPVTAAPKQGKGKKSKNQRRQGGGGGGNGGASGGGGAGSGEGTSTGSESTTGGAKQTGRKHRGTGGVPRQLIDVPNVGNAVCVNYILGSCRLGKNCKFLHPEGFPFYTPGMMCPFYAAGSCGSGLNCIFAHVLPGDRAYHMKPCLWNRAGQCPNGDACVFYHEKMNRPRDSRSSIPCSFWVRGYCAKGENCPFAHPDEYWAFQSPQEPNPPVTSAPEEKGKAESESSRFVENPDGTTTPKNQIACKYWARGSCPAGDKCEYRHDLFLKT